ncbi:MAG: arsenate reductase ArsC [Alphaproteobacteria bacterium]|nr:arsenate reductase ArsC [Alphaproteobacteria bacterium]
MADSRIQNVLFLCTGNSARSIMCEAYLNYIGADRFRAYSAGSRPAAQVNPVALEVLRIARVPVNAARPKSWEEFAKPGAPKMDFVFTVCSNAAKEACPIWPGQPISAHWPFEDPAEATGTQAEIYSVFLEVFRQIRRRLDIFAALPIASLDKLTLQRTLDDIALVRNPVA